MLVAMLETKPTTSDPFGSWLKATTPEWNWDWPYLAHVRRHLQRVTDGELRRLMLFMPPRHGKSEMVTVRYPVYRLERNPQSRVIVAAYNQTLSDKFSRKSRKLLQMRNRVKLNPDRTAVVDWETMQGGGYRSVGIGGGITGMGGDLIIIDDPVKSREDASSLTMRERAYDWFTDDLYTRLEPDSAIILIMTRWHEDDLAGRILNSKYGDGWEVVSLPALAEANDPLGRVPGEALCPARYPVEELKEIQIVQGRSFYALYQQRPQEQEGDMFKRKNFKYVDAVPADAVRVRYWDRGATAGGGDYTTGTLVAFKNGLTYIEDVVRGQWSTNERDVQIEDTTDADYDRYGNTVQIWLEQEPGSSGIDVIRGLQKRLVGYIVRGDRVTGAKTLRAEPFAAQVEAGNVYLKKAKWNFAWIDELCSFPNGTHDDQVDSASGAFNKLVKLGPKRKEARSISWVN